MKADDNPPNDAKNACAHLWRVDVSPSVSIRCIKCSAKGAIVAEAEQRPDYAKCTPTNEFGCEARAKLAKARGALLSAQQDLAEWTDASPSLANLLDEIDTALQETAQPNPCSPNDVDNVTSVECSHRSAEDLTAMRSWCPDCGASGIRVMSENRIRWTMPRTEVKP